MNNSIINLAVRRAKEAYQKGDVPVGAVIFNTQTKLVLCSAGNQVVNQNDITAHAELLALRRAQRKLKTTNLSGYSIFSTLEPCSMCAGAISWAQIDRLYFGAYDEKSGAVENGPCLYTCSTVHHKPEVYCGIGKKKCVDMLAQFFKSLR